MTRQREVEAKIAVPDLGILRARLLTLGAADEGEQFERNWVMDDAGGTLERRGLLLRVRCNDGGKDGILTVKRRIGGSAFKAREEVESTVDSVDSLLRQLGILGYRVACIYEKRRRTLLWRDCVVALDECPEIGRFIEIEGNDKGIRETCAELGLDPDDHIHDNYLGLWKKHLAARGEPHRHMIFGT